MKDMAVVFADPSEGRQPMVHDLATAVFEALSEGRHDQFSTMENMKTGRKTLMSKLLHARSDMILSVLSTKRIFIMVAEVIYYTFSSVLLW